MRLYRILKKPIVTEKSSNLEIANNTYVFEVSKDATKIDIKKSSFRIIWSFCIKVLTFLIQEWNSNLVKKECK